MFKRLFLLLFFLTLQGCYKVGPNYHVPCPCVPDSWHQEIAKGIEDENPPIQYWWTQLNDPVLNCLILRGELENLTLQEAFARIKEFRALRGIAVGERYPDINSFGSVDRVKTSKDFGPPSLNMKNPDTLSELKLYDALWELDVWGRISRLIESATADFQASIEAYRDVLVLLYSDIAATYVEIRTLQQRIYYAEYNANSQKQSLEVAKARYEAEITSEIDVFQAEQNYYRTEAAIPALRASMKDAINRLAVLLGDYPACLCEEIENTAPIPKPPEDIAVGLPMDLIRQRPDIRQAEREYAAEFARIGVATADLYPRFSLTGMFGYMASRDLFNASKQAWSYGANYFWNLFDGGRILSAIDAQYARAEQARIRYEQTLLTSVQEVESALSAYVEEKKRYEKLKKSVDASKKSVDLVKYLYRIGLIDFNVVLILERDQLEIQDELIQSEGFVIQNLIRIYKALGGGWCLNC